MDSAKLLGNKNVSPQVINIDNSRALINAALTTFVNMNLTQYLHATWKFITSNVALFLPIYSSDRIVTLLHKTLHV